MMHFENLLFETQRVYESHSDLRGFTPFPDDIVAQEVKPSFTEALTDFMAENKLRGADYTSVQKAAKAAAPFMNWLSLYDEGISDDFYSQFGCFTLIGEDGPFMSDKMRAWFLYIRPNFLYPWHEHPAEELYFVLGGKGEFMRYGKETTYLEAGDTIFHEASEIHALQTRDEPLLSLIIWRDDFEIQPMMSYPTPMEEFA